MLLLALASSAALGLSAVDRARLGLTLSLTNVATLATLYLAVADGMPIASLAPVAAFDVLGSVSLLAYFFMLCRRASTTLW